MLSALSEDEEDVGSPKLPDLSKDGAGRLVNNHGADVLKKRLDIVLHCVTTCFGLKCRV